MHLHRGARLSSAPDDSALRAERERLTGIVASLRAAFEDIVDAAADVATDDEHDPEGHTIAFERQQQAALLRETEAQIDEVDRALERMGAGSYGRCETCGAPIPAERLDAVPATRFCVTCAAV
ncbi:MAG TPA: TraR/DksA C4-type zinc finger protein [Microthrixaceae bacterium]|nr:TraR/DksA C4-type zinc finger protein [Microthrixaceae bacterium]HQF96550.1 TraR/DksA C4-type zinc finger protein [Microthrixaceae bacterium]